MHSYRFVARLTAGLLAGTLLFGANGLPKPKSPPPSYYAEAARAATQPVETRQKPPAKKRIRLLPVVVGVAAAGALAGVLVAVHDDNKTAAQTPLTVTPGIPSMSGPK